MSKITIVDVARLSGVGVSTVSRVINGHIDVSAKTREKVLSVIKETGYVPNDSARNLKRTDAKCIGVVIKRHRKRETTTRNSTQKKGT